VRLEGLTLSQMQTQFTELQQHVKAWSAMAARIDEFLSRLDKHTDAIEQLTRRLASDQTVSGLEPVEGRRLSLEEAEAEILNLFRERGTLHYSDIAETLRLDFATVVAATEELVAKGLIEEGDLDGQA
jgi:DNA-binding IclR family transcriptional regulator